MRDQFKKRKSKIKLENLVCNISVQLVCFISENFKGKIRGAVAFSAQLQVLGLEKPLLEVHFWELC